MKASGGISPTLGIAQARERLDADDAAAGARDDGLEARLDGLAGERPHECPLGLEPLHRALVEARVEQRRAVAPARLGGTQGRVGVAQERLGRGLAVAGERDARARRHAHLAAVQMDRVREDGAQLLGELERLALVLDLVADDGELVAADAGDGVPRPHRIAEALRDGDQQQVAREMAERVVDELDVIEIEHADGDQPPGAARAADRGAQAVEQVACGWGGP